MSGPMVSIDTDDASRTAAEWHGYADSLEEHGRQQYVRLDHLKGALGDIYEDFINAKGAEYNARSAAYKRVADKARGHALHLENTARNLTNADDDSAGGIARVLEA